MRTTALIPIEDAHKDPIEEKKEWEIVASNRNITVCFVLWWFYLLVWYYVGVFVCENAFQGHSLDLLVLMAEQLKTERNTIMLV